MAKPRRFTPRIVNEAREIWKAEGFSGVVRRLGWKVVAIAFCYYLVRDSVLYLLLPYLAARGLMPRATPFP